MQDIVYKLVPGLQEGKLWYDLFLHVVLHIILYSFNSLKKQHTHFQVMKIQKGGEGEFEEKYSKELYYFICSISSDRLRFISLQAVIFLRGKKRQDGIFHQKVVLTE